MILSDPRQTDTPDEGDRIEISLAELNIDESHREAVERICEFLRERGINIICTKNNIPMGLEIRESASSIRSSAPIKHLTP